MAELYIELFGRVAALHDDDLALIERHLPPGTGPVLDIGCGPGHLTEHLRVSGVDITGLDLVPAFIAHARATHPRSRFQLASLERLPVPDHAIGGILSWYSLIHIAPDALASALAELRRAIAPGGALVVGFFHGDEVSSFDHKVTTAYRWPADELSDRLGQAGFTEVERLRWPADPQRGVRAHATLAAQAD